MKHTICLSKIIKIIFILFFIFIVIIGRILYDEIRFFNVAEKFYKKNHLNQAIDYYEYVVNAYLPFSPYRTKSIQRILEISNSLEKANQLKGALYGCENLRSALLQSRSFYIPNEKLIKILDNRIAILKCEILKKKDFLKCYSYQYNLLKKLPDPSPFLSFLLGIFFILWILFVILFINKESKKFFIYSIISFFLWLLILYFL